MNDINVVYLNDSDGNAVPFEILDLIQYEGVDYVILMPYSEDQEDETQVFVFEIVPSENDDELETYIGVEDEKIIDALYEIFCERHMGNLK